MTLKLKTPPIIEPIPTAEMKLHLRVDFADDDALIDSLVKASRQHLETITSVVMLSQSWKLIMDAFPDSDTIIIPLAPLISIDSFRYIDSSGIEKTFDSSNYIVDTDSIPGRLVLRDSAIWPADMLQVVNGVVIEFKAGYGESASDIPEPLRQAIKLFAAHLYENREAVTALNSSQSLVELPMGVRYLIETYRMWQR